MRRFLVLILMIFGFVANASADEHAVHVCAGASDPIVSRTGRVQHQLSGGLTTVPGSFSRTTRTPFTPEQSYPLWYSGDPSNRLDIVILGDGYSASEQGQFHADAQKLVDRMFREQPFKSYQNYINVHRIDLVSQDSGVDNDPFLGTMKDTPLHSLFHCNGQERALCVDVFATKSAATAAPEADQIIVLANSSKYGGIAYFSDDIATLSGSNSHSLELFLHEFAHSFGNLADEYGVGGTYSGGEFSRKNVSVYDADDLSEHQAKWHAWIGYQDPSLGVVDAYEGAWNYSEGAFRPTFNSKMRSLGQPFNAPSIEAMILELYSYLKPIDKASPRELPIRQPEVLFVKPLEPVGAGLDVQWFLDGNPIENAAGNYLNLKDLSLELGRSYLVSVEVVDRTHLVRDDLGRNERMSQSLEWTIILDTHQFESDADRDGVFEVIETLDGTDGNDQGSLKQVLSHSACTLPNGYLEQINIASISNPSAFRMTGTADFRNSSGALISHVGFELSPGQKTDFIVNDMGLEANTIGTFCVTMDRASWSGGLTIYKPSLETLGNDFDFALYYPFEKPAQGKRLVSLNTNAIGTDGRGLVANWVRLSDAQAGDGHALSGEVLFYGSNGSLISTIDILVPDGGRVDLPGHEIIGEASVGTAQFVPSQPDLEYYIETTRYFYKGLGADALSFYTAFAIPTSLPSGAMKYGFLHAEENALTVVESVNAQAESSDALLEVFNSGGTRVAAESWSLRSKESRHYVVEQSAIVPGTVGAATIRGARESLSSISVTYEFDESGTLVSAFANGFGHPGSRIQYGEFNSFIQHSSLIDIQNTSDRKLSAFIDVVNYDNSEIYNTRVTLAPHQSILVKPLLPIDSYGTVRIQSGIDNVLRVRTRIQREGQYTLPIVAR